MRTARRLGAKNGCGPPRFGPVISDAATRLIKRGCAVRQHSVNSKELRLSPSSVPTRCWRLGTCPNACSYPHQRRVSGRRVWEPGWGRRGRRLETTGWRKGKGGLLWENGATGPESGFWGRTSKCLSVERRPMPSPLAAGDKPGRERPCAAADRCACASTACDLLLPEEPGGGRRSR